jgi:hypothetical protein
MKQFIVALTGIFAVGLTWASMAFGVTHSYCQQSLRGGGSLAPDADVYTYANSVNAQNMVHVRFEGANGSYTVYEVIRFYRGASVWDRRFYCSGSGSTYSDGRSF